MTDQPMMNSESMDWDRVFSAAASRYDEIIRFFTHWGSASMHSIGRSFSDQVSVVTA